MGKFLINLRKTTKRYVVERRAAVYSEWRFNNKCRVLPAGKTLRIAVLAPATVHWTHDGWQTTRDVATRNTGLGVYVADLSTSDLDAGHSIVFTFFWPQVNRWEGADYSVTIQES